MKQLLKKIPLTLMTIYMCLGLLFLTSCDKNKNKSDDCNGVKWSQCIRQYLRELKDIVVVIDYTCTYVHV